MTAMVISGMFIHLYLASSVLLERFRTRNAIWGELVTIFALQPIFALWALLGVIVAPEATLSYSAPVLPARFI